MGWLIVVVLLVLPFLLVLTNYGAARIALLVFWLGCAGVGAWFLVRADHAEKDLIAVHPYALPDAPGTHRIVISPLSQGSMKAVLTGGSGVLSPADLKKFDWSFLEPFVTASWFEPKRDDGPGAGETLLFTAHCGMPPQGPLTLVYKVEPENAALLQGRSLVVGHDAFAKHMIAGHLVLSLSVLGWGLLLWGGGWMIVQILRELWPAKKNASVPAGTEAL